MGFYPTCNTKSCALLKCARMCECVSIFKTSFAFTCFMLLHTNSSNKCPPQIAFKPCRVSTMGLHVCPWMVKKNWHYVYIWKQHMKLHTSTIICQHINMFDGLCDLLCITIRRLSYWQHAPNVNIKIYIDKMEYDHVVLPMDGINTHKKQNNSRV